MEEQKKQIVGMKNATDRSREQAVAQQLKVNSIEKVLKRKKAEQRQDQEKKEGKRLEDSLVSRLKK